MKIENLYHIYKECKTISTDTRKLLPGSIFFALKGDNFDGNRFANEALDRGCAFAVVDDMEFVETRHASSLQTVPNVLQTLQDLAAHHRQQLKIPFIGITGSNGKTTTKELISAVLSRKYKVCATQGNLNNHIGVPLTVLSVDDHDVAIIEMGANHIGEIATLCKIADPDYGIITNIGRAHLEGFGSPEGVIIAKSELYDHLAKRNGKVFLDAGNSLLMSLAADRNLDPEYYGNAPQSKCSGEIADNSSFLKAMVHLHEAGENLLIQTSLVGDYNLTNILAAAGIGNFFGVEPGEIASAINEYTPSNSRSQFITTPHNKIVLDAYNANPNSMTGSIKNFFALSDKSPKMAILGDMLELGQYSEEEHMAILKLLKEKQIPEVILVGPEFCAVSQASPFSCYRKVEDLIEHLRMNPVKDHCILLKGSRGLRLEKLLEVL
jgi:UDP-N-acetylmuramoyl-tripeptide--D-alanyl-D-alanine ligase